MRSAILTVGTEILTGSILNTNAQFLADQLTKLGYRVDSIITVADSKEGLKNTFLNALDTNSLVIITGGLGPTMDDLTMESVAEALGLKLKLDQDWLKHIETYFNKRGLKATANNRKQAMLPENATKLDNPNGTACGALIENGDKAVILLPGVPAEMREMFNSLKSYLKERVDEELELRQYMLTGIGESAAEDMISDIVSEMDENRIITTYASPGEIEIRLTSRKGQDISDWDELIRERLGRYLYTRRNEKLYQTVSRYLMDKDLSLTTAESCTGGLISEMLTRIPGISQVFKLGLTTYSNEAKRRLLGVSTQTLDDYGAVSAETCREMCEGARKILNTDIAVAVTGNAGPGSEGNKPVGLVYTGIATEKQTIISENHFRGSRETIQRFSANKVFQMIRNVYFKTYD